MKLIKLLPILIIFTACDQNGTKRSDTSEHRDNNPYETDSTAFRIEDPLDHVPIYLTGILGKDMEIRMKIDQSAGGTMTGKYYYANIGVPIELLMTSIEIDNWVIEEYVKDKKTGTWKGKIDIDRFTGVWTGSNGSSYPFDLEISIDETAFVSGLKKQEKKLDPEAFCVLDQCIDGSVLAEMPLTDSVMDEWESGYIYLLSMEQWNNLDKKTKLLHCFKYPESYEQICAESPDQQPGMLYDQLPFNSSGASMSNRQYQFVENNRDFTIKQISNCISKTHKMDIEYYWVLSNLDATEMIPQLVNHYREGHITETAVLTLLIRFMHEYAPYQTWASEVKLFEPKEGEEEEDVWYGFYRSEPLTEEIENRILDFAEDFYVSLDIP